MSRDRTYRSLEYLRKSAATSRVLNLWQIAQREGAKPEHQENPFFRNTLLNRAMILKHRVRGSEVDLFDYPVQTATKILLPIAERPWSGMNTSVSRVMMTFSPALLRSCCTRRAVSSARCFS